MKKKSSILLVIVFSFLASASKIKTKPININTQTKTDPGSTSFPKNLTLTQMPINSAKDFGRMTCAKAGSEYQESCRSITDYSGFVYDKKRHQFLMFGGGHAAAFFDSIIALDPTTMTWKSLYDPTPCSAMKKNNLNLSLQAWTNSGTSPSLRPFSTHTYDMLGVFEDEFIMASPGTGLWSSGTCASDITNEELNQSGKVSAFNLNTKTWRFLSSSRFAGGGDGFPGMEFDPLANKFVALGSYGLHILDIQNDTKSKSIDKVFEGMNIEGNLVYFPPTDAFYYFVGNELAPIKVYELKMNRADASKSSVTLLTTLGQAPYTWRSFAFDSKNEIIGGGIENSTFFAFDPRNKNWSSQKINAPVSLNALFFSLSYDPVNQVFIFINNNKDCGYLCYNTWAYKYK